MIVCDEMQQLRKMLDKKKILWIDNSESEREDEEFPIWICRTRFEYNGKNWSAVNGFGTYGGWGGANLNAESESPNLGLLELYDWQHEPVGWLTAKEAMLLVCGN